MAGKELKYHYKEEIKKIIKMITEVGDARTVVMAPDLGTTTGEPHSKLRVYSHGGRIIELSTSKSSTIEVKYIPDENYLTEGMDVEHNKTYDTITIDDIKEAISLAEMRANVEKKDVSQKSYEERSIETALIYKNRTNTYKGIIIDMEFNCPKGWLGSEAKMRNGEVSKSGKPDLVVFDRETNSFGIIELKYNNQSCGNMEKHFVDFSNIIISGSASNIKEELIRKTQYLCHYELIPPISDKDIEEVRKNDIWAAFLFVAGDYKASKKIYDKVRVSDSVDKSMFGFRHYSSMDEDIEFNKSSFF